MEIRKPRGKGDVCGGDGPLRTEWLEGRAEIFRRRVGNGPQTTRAKEEIQPGEPPVGKRTREPMGRREEEPVAGEGGGSARLPLEQAHSSFHEPARVQHRGRSEAHRKAGSEVQEGGRGAGDEMVIVTGPLRRTPRFSTA